MKDFIRLFCLFWILIFILVGLLRVIWINEAPILQERNHFSGRINKLVLGPSNGEEAWVDSIIPNSLNFCKAALTMGGTMNRLKWMLEYNSVQVDTLIVCASWVAMVYQSDDTITEMLEYYEEKHNVLNYYNFWQHVKFSPLYWWRAVTSFPATYLKFPIEGGYVSIQREKINHPEARTRINKIISQAGGKDAFTEEYLRSHCSYQLDNLKEIQSYCNKHHIVLVILSTPIYEIPEMINDKGYRTLLRNEFGDSLLIADYSSFILPDTSYYGDLEHLNSKGAIFFSEHIAQSGLDLQYAIDYCEF